MGKKPISQGPDKRQIIAKLCRRDLKPDIFHACKTIKPKDLFINEHLTPVRKTILYVLRSAKRRYGDLISGCNSIEGRVYVWLKPPHPNAPGAHDTRMLINNRDKLEKFCHEVLNTQLSEFIDNWRH